MLRTDRSARRMLSADSLLMPRLRHSDSVVAWVAPKSNPDVEGHDAAREAFHEAGKPLDHRTARAELELAIRAADEQFRAVVTRLAAGHGATVR